MKKLIGVAGLSIVILFLFRGRLLRFVRYESESTSNTMNYADALADLCDLQCHIYEFAINENAGWVEHLGALGKDSVDRRSLGYSDSGIWRVIAGSAPGEEIAMKDVIMTIQLSAQPNADLKFKTSGGRIIFLQIDGDLGLVEKAKLAIGSP